MVEVGDTATLTKPWGVLERGTRLSVIEVRKGGMFFLEYDGKALAKGWTSKDRDKLLISKRSDQ